MAITITIGGTPIEFPETSASPNWAPAVVAFAQAVEAALLNVVGPFDVSPQIMNIDAYNPGSSIDIAALSFPVSQVRAISLIYSVYRQTSSASAAETGELRYVYNINNPVNNKWERTQTAQGDAKISFTISDTGQVSFTTTALAGTSHVGAITFTAKALLQNS